MHTYAHTHACTMDAHMRMHAHTHTHARTHIRTHTHITPIYTFLYKINLLKFYCYTVWQKLLMGRILTNLKYLMGKILTDCPGAINSVFAVDSIWFIVMGMAYHDE